MKAAMNLSQSSHGALCIPIIKVKSVWGIHLKSLTSA